ncbi:MAG TPA: hypothetical protein VFD03_09215 [Clostridia bacterium]|nr:hypothetical protein [Clostridia bacterium]
MVEILRKYDVAQPLLSRWKVEFIGKIPSVLDKKGEDAEKLRKEHEEEKELLIKKIGELSMDMDWLKKNTIKFQKWGEKILD